VFSFKFPVPPEITICETPEDVADAAADLIFRDQSAAIEARGVYRIAFSGGRTPKLLYERLASEEWRVEMNWENWEVFWSDERAVPPDHPDSNFRLAHDALLRHVPIGNVWRMPGEVPGLKAAADDYARTLRMRFGLKLPDFDTVLLGVGADGHTASLFPGHAALESAALVEAVEVPGKTPSRRLTLTLPVINHARGVVFLVVGSDKAETVRDIIEQRNSSLPASRVQPEEGECMWIFDEAAAHLIR